MNASAEATRLIRAFEQAMAEGVDQARAFLASPSGRKLRSMAATGLVLATPMILRHPFFRTPLGRVIEVGGAAALVARIAAVIRDWEPAPPARVTQS